METAIAVPTKPSNQIAQALPVVTSNSISQTGLTVPSLWWVQEQVQAELGGKLIDRWIAYPAQGGQPGRVDFVVNRQFWSLLDYLERYTFLSDFGTAARSYGYNVRVLNTQREVLAAHTCDFSAINIPNLQALQQRQRNTSAIRKLTDSLPCKTTLDAAGWRGGLQK
jgi:hypothetical protein